MCCDIVSQFLRFTGGTHDTVRSTWASFGVYACVFVAIIGGSYFVAKQLETENQVASVARVASIIGGTESPEETLVIAAVAMGFDDVAADILFIEVVQTFGNLYLSHRTKYGTVYPLIRVVSYLSPHFVSMYSFGALVFEELGHVDEALLLLDEGILHNPSAFELRLYRDFSIQLFKTHEYKKAIAGILGSMQLEDYPPQLERILAYAYEKDGQREKALQQWRRVWKLSIDPRVREVSMRHIHRLEAEQ